MASNRFINSVQTVYLSLSDRPAEEVKIRLKHGEWEVEITCLENRVKQVVEDILSSLDSAKIIGPAVQDRLDKLQKEMETLRMRPVTKESTDSEQEVPAKRGMTCRGLLENLWRGSYFGSERSLGEVHEELSRRGYNYDRTAVSHSLTDMVRENILTRIGTMRNYRYIQKQPPVEAAT